MHHINELLQYKHKKQMQVCIQSLWYLSLKWLKNHFFGPGSTLHWIYTVLKDPINKWVFKYRCNSSLVLCSVVTVIWLLNICEIFLWGVVEERNISLAHIGHCPRNLLTFSPSHHDVVSKSRFVESPNFPSIFPPLPRICIRSPLRRFLDRKRWHHYLNLNAWFIIGSICYCSGTWLVNISQ